MGQEGVFLGEQILGQAPGRLVESLIQCLADAAANLPVLHLALEFFILNAPIAGDLVDPKMGGPNSFL